VAARPPAIGLARGSLKSGNGGDRHPLCGRDKTRRDALGTGLGLQVCALLSIYQCDALNAS